MATEIFRLFAKVSPCIVMDRFVEAVDGVMVAVLVDNDIGDESWPIVALVVKKELAVALKTVDVAVLLL